MAQAINVADYIILEFNCNNDVMSLTQLQILLYYCQAFNLVINKKKLFEEKIEHGGKVPIVGSVKGKYHIYGICALPPPIDFNQDLITKEEKYVIDEVIDVYGQFACWKLRDFLYQTPPWKETKCGEIITDEKLIDYFKYQVLGKE